MKSKLLLISIIIAGLAIPVNMHAQNPEQIQMMDDVQDAKDDLLDAVDAKKGPPAAAAVARITKIITETRKFWADQKQDDIVKLADDTLAAAAEMDKLARSGNMANAKAAFTKLDLACQQCHNIHPENRLKK